MPVSAAGDPRMVSSALGHLQEEANKKLSETRGETATTSSCKVEMTNVSNDAVPSQKIYTADISDDTEDEITKNQTLRPINNRGKRKKAAEG